MHVPVLYDEVLSLLEPQAGGKYIDGTLGAGGHSAGILQASAPDGKLLAFDRDAQTMSIAQERLKIYGERVTYVHQNYAAMGQVAPQHGFDQVDGILLDLGLSSLQLDDPIRGFSFLHKGSLDMRFDTSQGQSAKELINTLPEAKLADIFWRYGEEKRSSYLAKVIVAARPLETTTQLAEVIQASSKKRGRKHPATLIFQALRIAVNQELQALEKGLNAGIQLLKTGGGFAIISFHSLEDRLVKQTFRQWSTTCVCPPEQPICNCGTQPKARLVIRKAIQATEQEVQRNSRSRSARLRVVEKL